jgi:hypothetical protein
VNIGALNDQFTQFGNVFSLATSLGNVLGGLWGGRRSEERPVCSSGIRQAGVESSSEGLSVLADRSIGEPRAGTPDMASRTHSQLEVTARLEGAASGPLRLQAEVGALGGQSVRCYGGSESLATCFWAIWRLSGEDNIRCQVRVSR